MPLDPYSGRPVYETVLSPDYGATPVRVIDPASAGPYAGVPCIVVDPSVVGPYGGQPIYVSTDPLALPVYAVSGTIGLPAGFFYIIDENGKYLVDENGLFLIGTT